MLRKAQCLGIFALALALAGLSATARADEPQGQAKPEYPQTEVALYVWGTSIASKVESDRGEVSQHISFQDLIKHLNGAVMLHGRMQLDEQWSVVSDVFWVHLRAPNESKQVRIGPRDGIVVDGEVKTALDQWLVELNGGYRLFRFGSLFSRSPEDPRHTLGEMYFGGRFYSINPDVRVAVGSNSPLGSKSFATSVGQNQCWVDPVVGLRFGIDLSRTTQLGILGDVGGFNLAGGYSSKFSWSQTTVLSWAFAESWRLHMGYRFLDFKRDFNSGELKFQIRGPFVALGYAF